VALRLCCGIPRPVQNNRKGCCCKAVSEMLEQGVTFHLKAADSFQVGE
jgi:hypothetical protein